MTFTGPLAVGITNKHWIEISYVLLMWRNKKGDLSDSDLAEAKKQLDILSSSGGTPEPSYEKFRIRAFPVLPAKAGEILASVPEKPLIQIAKILVVRDNNDVTFKKYYQDRLVFRDLAIRWQEVIQRIDGKVTTVGYEFAQDYSNLKEILPNLITHRRYVEAINSDDNLSSFAEGFSIDELDFVTSKLNLFNVSTFSSSNQNWFVDDLKDLANLTKGVIRRMRVWLKRGEADVDANLLSSAENSASAVINFSIERFALSFEEYSSVFSQADNAFSSLVRILRDAKMKFVEEEIAGIDKKILILSVHKLYDRIFDGERKREVFDKIFFEAPEVDNMIYRLSQQINNEYRGTKDPVCCVGFTEGAIILLGKIIPLLNFPLYLITDKLSFYGTEFSGDESKEVEIKFDNSKYDGKRVLILDDILDRGITVKKFLEQAKKKTKAIDFKVCMLFAKPNPENVFGDADFLGSMVPNVWVVGYGFDTHYKHRNADAVGPIKESFKNG